MNPHFLVPVSGTYSGGSWSGSYPLSNLALPQPGIKAESSDALEASTRFVLDAGASADWQMFALIGHNMDSFAEVQTLVSNNADLSSPTLDVTTGVDNANVPWGALAYGVYPYYGEETPWYGGRIWFYLHSSVVSGRYVSHRISNTANDDGVIRAGVHLAGVPFVPGYGFAPSLSWGENDPSQVTRGARGTPYSKRRNKNRTVQGRFAYLTEAEVLDDLHALQAQVGRSSGVLMVEDPEAESGLLLRKTIYGVLSASSLPLGTVAPSHPWALDVAIEELVVGD